MKKLSLSIFALILMASMVFSQTWQYDSIFSAQKNPHAVLVAPDGKIWVGNYSRKDTLITGTDTLITNPIRIFNEDGTLFAKIRTITVDGVTDTIVNSCRGMSLDNNGNVLFTNWNVLYRINYQTLEGMNKFDPEDNGSMTEAATTDDGYVYLAHVGPNHPAYILDEDLALFGYVDDTLAGLQRSLLVTADGNDVYYGKIYTKAEGVWHYKSTDGAGAESESFALVDTFGTVFNDTGAVVSNMWAQCLDWDANGLMWVGTYWDVADNDFNGWYALDPTQGFAVVDTIGHNADMVKGDGNADGDPSLDAGDYWSPRGIAFSADGHTAYTADFDGGNIKKWTNADPKKPGDSIIPFSDMGVMAIDEHGTRNILVNFELKQNYPNPFNPSTTIPFELNATKHVTLKVYDINGRLVSTLINAKLAPKQYEYKFDGSNLSSGTYIYQLNVDGQLVNKQMVLIK